MKKISKKKSNILILGVVLFFGFSLFGFFLVKAKAEEQINIFPSSVSGDWQHQTAVLNQDLGPNAGFEEFNNENSSYPFALQNAILYQKKESNFLAGFLNKINPIKNFIFNGARSLFKGNPARAQEFVTPSQDGISFPQPSPSPTETPELTSTPTPTLTPTPTPTPTPTETPQPTPAETPQPTPTETPAPGITAIVKTLELSNFNIPEDVLEKQIQKVQLKLSLAGRGESRGDKLLIGYQARNSERNLGEIILGEINLEETLPHAVSYYTISNGLLGEYRSYDLSEFKNWEDLKNLKIEFKFFSNSSKQSRSILYLDAAWLRVDYEDRETEEEQKRTTVLEKGDDFNALSAGVLYGQGIWKGVKTGKDWMVGSSGCPIGSSSGGGCLVLEGAATAEFENTIDTGQSFVLLHPNSIISFSFYPNWMGEPTVAFNLYLRTLDDKSEQVHLDFNTGENNSFYVFLSDGETDVAVFNLPLKQWYKVELNIDKNARQARFRVNGGEWTNFVSWTSPGQSISLLRLRGMVEGEANFYLDNLLVSEFTP